MSECAVMTWEACSRTEQVFTTSGGRPSRITRTTCVRGKAHRTAAASASAAGPVPAVVGGWVVGPRSDRLVRARRCGRGFAHSGGARFRPSAVRAVPDKHVLVRIAGPVVTGRGERCCWETLRDIPFATDRQLAVRRPAAFNATAATSSVQAAQPTCPTSYVRARSRNASSLDACCSHLGVRSKKGKTAVLKKQNHPIIYRSAAV